MLNNRAPALPPASPPAPEPPSDHMLAGLLAQKMCHDLVNAFGPIGAALDVIEDDTASDMHGEAFKLLRAAADRSWATLEYMRIAYAPGGSSPERIEAGAIRKIVTEAFTISKATFAWKLKATELEKPAARVLVNLCNLAVGALHRGGLVTVEVSADGVRMKAAAEGPRAGLADHVARGFHGKAPSDGWNPRHIHSYYTWLIAKAQGGSVAARQDGDRVEFVAVLDGANRGRHS